MKDQILKIAKVKSEKEFYKKYPTEEAFMKAHGKAFKKAEMGSKMVNDQLHQLTDFGNPAEAQDGGMFNIANAISSAFTKPGKPATATSAATPATGGFGDAMVGLFGGDPGKISDVGAKGALGEGGAGFAAGAEAAGVGILNAAPQILQGVGQIKQQQANIKKADQFAQLSGVTAQAAESRPEQVKRKYVRPEDALVQPGQLGSPQGTGTNYLAQNGKTIGGTPTEIQNTYNPGNLYNDLGYEPLNDSNPKQYAFGGHVPTAEFGDYFQDSGQASIGKGVGSAIGSAFFGPLGGQVGGFLGGVAGNLLGGADDANKLARFQDIGKKNTQRAAFAGQANALHAQNAAYMAYGGSVDSEHEWVSNGWQPQVIAKFGDLDVSQVHSFAHEGMDALRAGGHLKEYTPPSAEAMYTGKSQYAMGGDLQTHWGGEAETMSHNPYLPDGGETVMFRGQSHDETDGKGRSGIGVTYGDSPVEVERGEPAVKLKDGGESGEDNLVVFGNMMIPDYGVKELEDKNAKGKKFKNYVADLSKKEAKHNKTIEKATEIVNNSNGNDPFDQLSLNAGKAMIMGANSKLKDIADKKQKAAMVQNAILDTAEEFGVESDGLAKGKIRPIKDPSIGKDGKKLKKAQGGWHSDWEDSISDSDQLSAADLKMISKGMSQPGFMGVGANNLPTITVSSSRKKLLPADIIKTERIPNPIAPLSIDPNKIPNITMAKSKNKGKFNWKDLASTALTMYPFFRPTNQEPLDPSQLTGEMYALGNNQLQGVQAQTYQPMLDQPYDISLQDQLNAIDSQSRAAILAAGQDPAAQSVIMAQSADLKNKVLGEQFRLNQAEKARVYQANRQALNQAQLQNLGILDTQYGRQETAKSKTKAETLAALNSISDKIAKNKLENRQLGIMENMYNYRYDTQGRAYNINNPAQFNIPELGLTDPSLMDNGRNDGTVPVYDNKGNIISYKVVQPTKTTTKKRNGSIVKAIKNL